MCLEQDLGKESVEEREMGVMIEEGEAVLEEVDAMSRKFSLSLKALFGKELEVNFYHTILVRKQIRLWYHFGFTEVNPYPIHQLRIFKFSIHIQSTDQIFTDWADQIGLWTPLLLGHKIIKSLTISHFASACLTSNVSFCHRNDNQNSRLSSVYWKELFDYLWKVL